MRIKATKFIWGDVADISISRFNCSEDNLFGDALPSRRELAVLLGINPNTAQKAYKALEEEGIMHTDGNAGSVISVTPEMRAELLETLKEEAVQTFLSNVKALGLSFQQSIALLTEKWEE